MGEGLCISPRPLRAVHKKDVAERRSTRDEKLVPRERERPWRSRVTKRRARSARVGSKSTER
eukprot:8546696-Pyramimonas_sp.AAC.1